MTMTLFPSSGLHSSLSALVEESVCEFYDC